MRVSPANSWISHDIVGPNCHIFVIIDDVCWWNDGRGGKVLSTKVLHFGTKAGSPSLLVLVSRAVFFWKFSNLKGGRRNRINNCKIGATATGMNQCRR